MIEAWLAGDVPHEVMADWCEEQGVPFPRTPAQNVFRQRIRNRRSWSGSSKRRRRTYAGSTSGGPERIQSWSWSGSSTGRKWSVSGSESNLWR